MTKKVTSFRLLDIAIIFIAVAFLVYLFAGGSMAGALASKNQQANIPAYFFSIGSLFPFAGLVASIVALVSVVREYSKKKIINVIRLVLSIIGIIANGFFLFVFVVSSVVLFTTDRNMHKDFSRSMRTTENISTAKEWLQHNVADYADIKKSVDTCKVRSVSLRELSFGESTERFIVVMSHADATERYLPLEDKDRLKTDIDAVSKRCVPGPSWSMPPFL